MNRPPPRFPGAPPPVLPDDPSIPVLTERLGLPPLEFDTTLPMIDTTGLGGGPMLEGLTALPDPPQPYEPPVPPPAPVPVPASNVHPIAALPFPPIMFPDDKAVARPAPYAPLPAVAAALPVMPVMAALPDAAPAPPAPTAPPPAPVTLATSSAAAPSAQAAVNPGQHWGRIEMELRSSILRQITQQLPQEIDGIVQGRMQEAIGRLLASLAEEIHLAVTASLADIVERAVRAELDRMRNSNRG